MRMTTTGAPLVAGNGAQGRRGSSDNGAIVFQRRNRKQPGASPGEILRQVVTRILLTFRQIGRVGVRVRARSAGGRTWPSRMGD